jgi:RNA recognition motif-containing protein
MACTRVFVGNVAGRPPASVLENHFGACGSIASVDVKPGYAFIEFNDVLSAETAIATMHGSATRSQTTTITFQQQNRCTPYD